MKKRGILVSEFFEQLKGKLSLRLIAGRGGLNNRITVAELNRPGLALAGYTDYYASQRIQVLGKAENSFINNLPSDERMARLESVFSKKVPCIILARRIKPPQELVQMAEERKIPLIRSHYMTMKLINQATIFLEDKFAPSLTMNADHVEVFGVGILILGKSGSGKSETALGLVSKGHRLIADDIVRLKLTEAGFIIGEGARMTRHFMELRGLGIINVQTLFGVGSVKERKKIELIITLEQWNAEKEYERLGIESEYKTILGTKIPHITIPVRPGRDIISLVEVAALNYRLKKLGVNPALELNNRLLEVMRNKAFGSV